MNVGMSLVGFSDVWVLEFINKSIELFPACSDTYPLHIGVGVAVQQMVLQQSYSLSPSYMLLMHTYLSQRNLLA